MEPRSVKYPFKQPSEARRIALQHFSYVPGIFRSHDDPISSALHVAPAPLLWPARRHQHGFRIGGCTLAAGMEGPYTDRCRAATRVAADLCGRADPGRAPTGGAWTSRGVAGVAVLQSICT